MESPDPRGVIRGATSGVFGVVRRVGSVQFWGSDGELYVLTHASAGPADPRTELVHPTEAGWVIRRAMEDARTRDRLGGLGLDALGGPGLADRIGLELRRPAGRIQLHRVRRVRHPVTWASTESAPWLRDLGDGDPIEAPREEPPEPEPQSTELHWIELQVVHENGVPFAELMVEIELPDGACRVETLDGGAWIRVGDLPNPAACRVRFPDGVHLPKYAERPAATPISPKAGDRPVSAIEASDAGIVLAVDQAHRIIVQRPIVSIVQMSEIQFGLARAVVLPETPDEDAETTAPEETPLSAIASALGFAVIAERPRSVLVAGHTDTTGGDDSNLVLSQARADNVQLLLAGDRAAWAEHCQGHYAVDDVQRILRWAARERGWACDPGAIDNDLGKQTRGALKAFRQAYNHEMAGALDPDADIGPRDWEAFAELYDQKIAERLSALGHIADIRAAVKWTAPSALGCGEEWPVENTALDEYASASNRRVDILFFDDIELPDLGASPPGVDVYGSDRYRAEPVPLEPWAPGQSLEYEVWVKLQDQWDDEVLAERDYRIVGPLPERTHERHGTTDADGTLREQELPWGDYWVEVDGAGVFCGTRYMGHDPNDHADLHRVPGLGRAEVPARPERPEPKWEVPVTGIDELADLADIVDPFQIQDDERDELQEQDEPNDDVPLADVG
jgi:hypothetical protein